MAIDGIAQSVRICWPQNLRLIYSNHNIRRFHDHCHLAAGLNAEFVNTFICDGRGDRLAVADIHDDVTGRGPLVTLVTVPLS
jgi:hypothetical protein